MLNTALVVELHVIVISDYYRYVQHAIECAYWTCLSMCWFLLQ
jgi:hypothetical protein